MVDLRARMQLREEWERSFEETLAQLQESYRQLLLVNQSAVLDGPQKIIAPPHSSVRLQASANEVVTRAQMLLQQIQQLRIHAILLGFDNSNESSTNS